MTKRVRTEHPFQPPDWPATQGEMWPVTKIKPYENNPRTHPPAQIEALAQDMLDDGVTMPILVDETGIIIAGHGRLLAALKNKFLEYPVVIARGWTEERKRAVRLKDNQRGLQSGWDHDLIRVEFRELKLAGYDMQRLGFGEAALRSWGVGSSAAPEPEVVPEPTKKPVPKVGDLWHLGQHRLMVGDSTARDTWTKLMGRERASMVFTDPPYGVSYRGGDFAVIKGDDKRRDDLYQMLTGALRQMVHYATDRAAFYIWHASSTREDFAQAMKAAALTECQYIMWVKPALVFGRADYQWQHEPCFYASKGQAPAFYGERAESTVWHAQIVNTKDVAITIGPGVVLLDGEGGTLFVQARAPKTKKVRQVRITKDTSAYLSGAEQSNTTVWEVARDGGHEHPTQKPVELARRAIENSSKPGEIVADGFLGSGTTLIGAEMTGRRCFGVELDPVYAEVILQRWQRFTGQEATLAATGESFEATRGVRTGRARKRAGGAPTASPEGKRQRKALQPAGA